MRTVRTKVYKFDELNEDAKQFAIEQDRNKSSKQNDWADENKNTLEKFADVFNISIKNWSYGGRGEGVFWSDNWEYEEIGELKGIRLSSYLWNNYKNDLFKGKYYNVKSSKQIKHKRVKSFYYKNSEQFGNFYYSAITLEASCVLTGYCMDNDILEPIYRELNKPTGITFKELIDECFNEWIIACNDDLDYQNSDEYISQYFINNEIEFTKEGKQF